MDLAQQAKIEAHKRKYCYFYSRKVITGAGNVKPTNVKSKSRKLQTKDSTTSKESQLILPQSTTP